MIIETILIIISTWAFVLILLLAYNNFAVRRLRKKYDPKENKSKRPEQFRRTRGRLGDLFATSREVSLSPSIKPSKDSDSIRKKQRATRKRLRRFV